MMSIFERNVFTGKNRKILAGFCAAALLSSLAGCMTYQGQLDTSVPIKEQVTLVIHLPLNLREVDGQDVAVEFFPGLSIGSARMSLPVGEHQLDFEYESMFKTSDAAYTYEHHVTGNSSTTYNFVSGYEYHAYPYTEVMGARTGNVDTAVMMGMDSGLRVSIQRNPKQQSGANVAIETGALFGLGKGPTNLIGLNGGISPFGLVVDTGKVSFGFDTYVVVNVGYAPNPLEKEFKENNVSDTSYFALGMEYSAGAMFNFFINRDNGKAMGLGVGGGYVWDGFAGHTYNQYDEPFPAGVFYLRGAIIPDRNTKFSIYFDYYLKDLLPELPPNNFGSFRSQYYWEDIVHHPRSWASWGIGILGKMF